MTGALIALAFLLPAAAGAEPGLTSAAFLQQALGARAAGMGGAFTAVRGSIDSAQYNPAGLATLDRPAVSSTYLTSFGSSRFGLLQYAHPTNVGTFSAGALYYTAGRVDLAFSNGTTRSATAEEDTAWTASYGLQLLPGAWIGATYRYLKLALADTAHASSSQFDLGAIAKLPFYGLSAGAAYQYLGPDIKFEEAGDPPPKTLRYGVAFHFPDVDPKVVDPSVDLQAFDMTLAGDMAQVLREKPSPRVGLELGLTPALLTRVAIRFGWVFNRDSNSFTMGAGVEHGSLRFDYALGRARELENTQMLTLTYLFGNPKG